MASIYKVRISITCSTMHLVFLIHGLFGNPSHLNSMLHSLEARAKRQKSDIVVHRAQSISTTRTFDGIEANAERLYLELVHLLTTTNATEISIVGYSLGGLLARMLVGMLHEDGILEKVKPKIFATFATPHLGSTFVTSPSLSVWSPSFVFSRLFNAFGPWLVGPTGRDLFRKNNIINDLSSPQGSSMLALRKFENLFIFANGIRDRTVHFWTAFIADRNPFNYISTQSENSHGHKNSDINNANISSKGDITTKTVTASTSERTRPMSISTFDGYPMFVDLESSRYGKNPHLNSPILHTILFAVFVPPLFLVLIFLLIGISSYAWSRSAFRAMFGNPIDGNSHRHAAREKLMSTLQQALETSLNAEEDDGEELNTMMTNEGDNKIQCAWSPGYKGLIESCPETLDLPQDVQDNIRSLNSLPWQKYAVVLPRMNTHSQIVDRMGETKDGKAIMDYFAYRLCND